MNIGMMGSFPEPTRPHVSSDPVIPFVARPACPEDYAHFERFFMQLGMPDPVPSARAFAGEIAPHALVLEEVSAGAVLGYAYFSRIGALGRLFHVVVDRDWQRQGLGRALMGEVRAHLRAAGCTRLRLYVKPDNAAAIALYRKLGLKESGWGTRMRVPWSAIAALPAAPGDVAVEAWPATAPRAEDEEVERALGLPQGLLEHHRRRPGNVFIVARRPGPRARAEVVGFCAFDRSFPGAAPFCAQSLGAARGLLDAMQRFSDGGLNESLGASPGAQHVLLFLEDPEIATRLQAAGAEPQLEVLRMEGAL